MSKYNLELKEAVSNFRNSCKDMGEFLMREGKNVPITFTVLNQTPDNKFVMGVIPSVHDIYDPNDKSAFVGFIKMIIATMRPVAIGFVTEAWLVKRDKDRELDKNMRVSEQPDKKEVVIVQVETFTGSSIAIYDIIRNGEDVRLKIDTDEEDIDKKNTEGIFTNLLKENYDKLHKEFMQNIENSKN
jgi:hypothetical protein